MGEWEGKEGRKKDRKKEMEENKNWGRKRGTREELKKDKQTKMKRRNCSFNKHRDRLEGKDRKIKGYEKV